MAQKSRQSSKAPADIEQMLQDQAKRTVIKETELNAKQRRLLEKAVPKTPPADSTD